MADVYVKAGRITTWLEDDEVLELLGIKEAINSSINQALEDVVLNHAFEGKVTAMDLVSDKEEILDRFKEYFEEYYQANKQCLKIETF